MQRRFRGEFSISLADFRPCWLNVDLGKFIRHVESWIAYDYMGRQFTTESVASGTQAIELKYSGIAIPRCSQMSLKDPTTP